MSENTPRLTLNINQTTTMWSSGELKTNAPAKNQQSYGTAEVGGGGGGGGGGGRFGAIIYIHRIMLDVLTTFRCSVFGW